MSDTHKTIEGMLNAKGLKLNIVASRFNEFITAKLLSGALDCWKRHGGAENDVTVAWVPGAWEMPAMAKRFVESGSCDAVVCVGAVSHGGTPHLEYVASETSKGIAQVGMNSKIPVTFGVLTTDTIEQAIERAGTKAGNKGWEATLAAIEMANLYKNSDADTAE